MKIIALARILELIPFFFPSKAYSATMFWPKTDVKLLINLRTFCSRTRRSCKLVRAPRTVRCEPSPVGFFNEHKGCVAAQWIRIRCSSEFSFSSTFARRFSYLANNFHVRNCRRSWFVIFSWFAGSSWKNKFSERVRGCTRSFKQLNFDYSMRSLHFVCSDTAWVSNGSTG